MFGYVIGGLCSTPIQAPTTPVCCLSNTGEVDGLLRVFQETKETPTDSKHLSPDNQKALTLYQESVTREENGHYRVCLPRREPNLNLGHSRKQAVQRFESNRHLLQKQDKWEDFTKAVADY